MRFSILIFSVIFLFISCGSSKDETSITLVIGPRSGATVSPGRNIDLKNSFLLTGQNLAAIKTGIFSSQIPNRSKCMTVMETENIL